MKYEYDYETVNLTEDQQQMIQMGLANIEALNSMVRDVINARAKDGWEPLYPFSMPSIWFRKPKAVKRKKTTKKKVAKKS